ncbi:hypothetical protein WMF30_09645 [Sorangium sp. So ce134]
MLAKITEAAPTNANPTGIGILLFIGLTAVLLIALYSGVLVCRDAARSLRFLVGLIKGDAAA